MIDMMIMTCNTRNMIDMTNMIHTLNIKTIMNQTMKKNMITNMMTLKMIITIMNQTMKKNINTANTDMTVKR